MVDIYLKRQYQINYLSSTGIRCKEVDGHEIPRGEGGLRILNGVGMLVVSLRGINFGFWSHLGCSRQNAIIFSLENKKI